MPNIPSYDSPSLGLVPTETGIEALTRGAVRGGAFYDQAAQALDETGQRIGQGVKSIGDVAIDYMDHQEISAGAKNGTALIAQKEQEWNNFIKDPGVNINDPTVAKKFIDENIERALQNFQDGFSTQKSQAWATDFADRFRQHMFTKTSADMSTMAGAAAVRNTTETINTLGNATFNDPSSLNFARDTLKASVDGIVSTSPTLTPDKAAEVRNELMDKGQRLLTKEAVTSVILRGGDWQTLANDPANQPYIDPGELTMFARAAKMQQKQELLTNRQLEQTQRQQNEQAAHDAANKVLTDNVTADPRTGAISVAPPFFQAALKIATMPNAPPDLARTLMDWGAKKQSQEDSATDPVVKKDLTDRLFDPTNPTSRIDLMKAQTAGKLSDRDFTAMDRLVTEMQTAPIKADEFKDTMEAAKGVLTYAMPGVPGKDPQGLENYARFVQSFLPQYIQQSRTGTLPPNALDVSDPNSMISKSMAPFKRTPAQLLHDRIVEMQGLGETGVPGTAAGPNPSAVSAPSAPPPAGTREVGKVYPSPNGPMEWTGTGWKRVSQ